MFEVGVPVIEHVHNYGANGRLYGGWLETTIRCCLRLFLCIAVSVFLCLTTVFLYFNNCISHWWGTLGGTSGKPQWDVASDSETILDFARDFNQIPLSINSGQESGASAHSKWGLLLNEQSNSVHISEKLFGATGCTTFSGENYIFVQKFYFCTEIALLYRNYIFCTEITFLYRNYIFCTEIALSPIAAEEVNIRAYLDFSYNEQINGHCCTMVALLQSNTKGEMVKHIKLSFN